MLPAPVVRARLSLHLFVSLCFDSSLDLWKGLSPLITVRESTDVVIRLMFCYGLILVPHGGLFVMDVGGLVSNVRDVFTGGEGWTLI